MRVGIGSCGYGFDPSRVLMLGGVKVPGAWGLRGPSDADALLRAVADALLGAAGLGDIEDHFPARDPEWAHAPSAAVVAACVAKLAARGLAILHVDASVHAQRPDLRDQRAAMRTRLATLLRIEEDAVNVKSPGAGQLGGEGIDALAVVTVEDVAVEDATPEGVSA
jgi:2-C-methyl-D-erythritol 2,4-cyclodiphosphate synthase